MEKPIGERMASVETKVDGMSVLLTTMNGKFDTFILSAVTHTQLAERLKEQNDRIDDLSNKIAAVDKRRWAQNTLSAVFGSVLTGLIGYIVLSLIK